ncbi:MAG: serine hydrolase [Streptococcaceae bacterium]|jgi:beta-lactamase class C|nr:serine hydrolase [Streptococcaceae bacterium]
MLKKLKIKDFTKVFKAVKGSWRQILVLVILLSPAFFWPPKKEKVEIIRKTPTSLYLTVIPKRAIALQEFSSYSDKKLTKKKSTIKGQTELSITNLDNSDKVPVYKLSDGSYIPASSKNVGSDVVLTSQKRRTTVYLMESVNSLYSPFTVYDSEIYSRISGGQALQTLAIATTHWGKYYNVLFDGGHTGWIDAKSVKVENPDLSGLQQTLNAKYGNNPDISITVKQLDTSFTATVNSDKMIYAASLWKLPILYWTQKQLYDGNASLSDMLQYRPEVNDLNWGAFDPAGTGSMSKIPDNQMYQLHELINLTAKESDNVASNMLAYYETDKFSADYQKSINQLAGKEWSFTTREATTTMVANVMNGLYDEGGAAFNALFNTSYDDSRIEAGLPSDIHMAHKIGIADEENHDAAVIFTSQPYILVVMTTGSQPSSVITDISQTVYEALK